LLERTQSFSVATIHRKINAPRVVALLPSIMRFALPLHKQHTIKTKIIPSNGPLIYRVIVGIVALTIPSIGPLHK